MEEERHETAARTVLLLGLVSLGELSPEAFGCLDIILNGIDHLVYDYELIEHLLLLALFDYGHDGIAVVEEVHLTFGLQVLHLTKLLNLQLHQSDLLMDVD